MAYSTTRRRGERCRKTFTSPRGVRHAAATHLRRVAAEPTRARPWRERCLPCSRPTSCIAAPSDASRRERRTDRRPAGRSRTYSAGLSWPANIQTKQRLPHRRESKFSYGYPACQADHPEPLHRDVHIHAHWDASQQCASAFGRSLPRAVSFNGRIAVVPSTLGPECQEHVARRLAEARIAGHDEQSAVRGHIGR
jgi:hypothetical protein